MLGQEWFGRGVQRLKEDFSYFGKLDNALFYLLIGNLFVYYVSDR